jgi:hypothetical protein
MNSKHGCTDVLKGPAQRPERLFCPRKHKIPFSFP